MIVKEQPSGLTLFVEMQGSIVPQIFSKIAGFTVFSIVVMALDYSLVSIPHVSFAAMSVFGIALSLFLWRDLDMSKQLILMSVPGSLCLPSRLLHQVVWLHPKELSLVPFNRRFLERCMP